MNVTLKEVFDQAFERVKFDQKLAKALYRYQLDIVNRNEESLAFFGSNLLGVHVIRFRTQEVLDLVEGILEIDFAELTAKVRTVTTIDHSFKVSGDVFNLTLMYMIHRFLIAPMPQKDRDRAAYDVSLVFFYRCVMILSAEWFKYPVDPKIAQAAYGNLSNKYLIKKLGSWGRVMDYRAKDLSGRSGIHHKSLWGFDQDDKIVYAINDSQNRIRELLKNYTAEFKHVHSQGESVGTTSSTVINPEGEESYKDKTSGNEKYINYMRGILMDENTFIRDDLVEVIVSINTNTSFKMVRTTLAWLSENYGNPKYVREIDEFVALVLVQSMYMIQSNSRIKSLRDYPNIVQSLKNQYLSTRTEDPEIAVIRKKGQDLIKKSNKSVSGSLILATRTSIILYITLRALVGQNR